MDTGKQYLSCLVDGPNRVWHITANSSDNPNSGVLKLATAVTAIDDVTDLTEILSLISLQARHFGFERVSTFCLLPALAQRHLVYSSDNDWEWVKYYRDNGFFQHDPSIRVIGAQRSPFSWDSAFYRKNLEASLSAPEKRTITRAMDYGISQVACLPFQGGHGERGAIRLMRVGQKPIPPSQLNRIFIQSFFLFHTLFQRQIELLRRELQLDTCTLLTSRELDVLRLYALGNNPAGIADALEISSSTVQQHLRNVRGKLGVRSSVHAVAKVGSCGLLTEC